MKKRPDARIIASRAERIYKLITRPEVLSLIPVENPTSLVTSQTLANLGLVDEIQFVGVIKEIVNDSGKVRIRLNLNILKVDDKSEYWYTVKEKDLEHKGLYIVIVKS